VKRQFVLSFSILFLIFFIISGCGGGDSVTSSVVNTPQNTSDSTVPGEFSNPFSLPDSDGGLAEHVPGEIVVHYRTGTDPEKIAKMINGSLETTFSIGNKSYARISLPENREVVNTIKSLNMAEEIIYAEPCFIYRTTLIPDDTYYDRQYAPQSCKAEEGWNTTTGSSSVTIAILDTGVNGTHPDFCTAPGDPSTTKVVTGQAFYDNGGGHNSISAGSNSDISGHGTHVAGIAGAVGNNGLGIAGVAWGCKIMPLMVFSSSGYAFEVDIAKAIEWSVDNGANVINMSLAGFGYSQVINDAVTYAVDRGKVVVVSMGNDGMTLVTYPAASPGVIAVGALNGRDEVADFSSTGYNMYVTAPGKEIYSTSIEGEYVPLSGTSMASPFVAGICALILSAHPGITPQQVKSQLEATATDLGTPGFDPDTGWGKPNIAAAMGALQANKYGSVTVTTSDVTYGAKVVLYDSAGRLLAATRTNEEGEARFPFVNTGSGYVARIFDYVTGTTRSSSSFTVTAGVNTVVPFTGLSGPFFMERFEGEGFPPAGWAVNTARGHGWHIHWLGNKGNRENYTGGYGIAAAIDSDEFGHGETGNIRQTTELLSPPLNLSVPAHPTLYFKSDFSKKNNQEGWLEISTDGGMNWTLLEIWNSYRPSEQIQIDLTPYKGSTVVLRWRYDDYASRDWWWQIDDVFILSEPSAMFPRVVDGEMADIDSKGQ